MRKLKFRLNNAAVGVGAFVALSSPLSVQAVMLSEVANRVDVHGEVRVEAYFGEGLNNSDQSDIQVDYAQFGFDVEVNDTVSTHIYALHEDDGTDPWVVDEAYVSMGFDGFFINAGRMYIPFGTLQINMITDPLTYSLTETRESAVLFGAEYEGVYGSFYLFNGEVNEATLPVQDDTVDHVGFTVGFASAFEEFDFDVGFDFLSNVSDSFVIRAQTGTSLQEYVSGFVLHGTGRMGPFSLLAEYVDTGEFNSADLAFKGGPAELYALNLEAGMDFFFLGNESTVSVGLQFTDEAVALGLPESRFAVGLRSAVMDNTSVGLEFRWDEDYSLSDGGTGNDAVTLSAQLAVAF